MCAESIHLCAADSLLEDDVKFTRRQTEVFFELLEWLKEQEVTIPTYISRAAMVFSTIRNLDAAM